MALAINGFGTAFHGERDFRPDGSFITTEWIIVACLPVVPLRSLRVIRNPRADQAMVVYTSEGFLVLEKTGVNIRQVIFTWGFVLLCALWEAILVVIATRLNVD
jgi:hypothetical protein